MYILIAQVVLGLSLAFFTPTDILSHSWSRDWVMRVLSVVAPKMSGSSGVNHIPEVVLFYHAVMLATWPLWVLTGFGILLSAPNGIGKVSKNSALKLNTSRSILVAGYLFVALLLIVFVYALSQGDLYMLSHPSHIYGGPHPAYSRIIQEIWVWNPRAGLSITSILFWPIPTALALFVVTAPSVLWMYWDALPWFKEIL